MSSSLTSFPASETPNLAYGPMATGTDGKVWFEEGGGGINPPELGRLSTSGQFDSIPLPTNIEDVNGLTAGPDGNMWFAATGVDPTGQGNTPAIIGRVTPAGVVTEFVVPGESSVQAIAAAPGGHLDFIASGSLGTITTSGQIAILPVSLPIAGGSSLAVDRLGDLWVVASVDDEGNGQIDRVTPQGQVTSYPLPTIPVHPGPNTPAQTDPVFVEDMATERDGDVWITEGIGDQGGAPGRIVRATPSGKLTTFTIPSLTQTTGPDPHSGNPAQITPGFGRDPDLYFSAQDIDQDVPTPQHEVGRISPTGRVTIFHLSFPAGPLGNADLGDSADGPIAAGSDGNVYFFNAGLGGDEAPHLERLNLHPPARTAK